MAQQAKGVGLAGEKWASTEPEGEAVTSKAWLVPYHSCSSPVLPEHWAIKEPLYPFGRSPLLLFLHICTFCLFPLAQQQMSSCAF